MYHFHFGFCSMLALLLLSFLGRYFTFGGIALKYLFHIILSRVRYKKYYKKWCLILCTYTVLFLCHMSRKIKVTLKSWKQCFVPIDRLWKWKRRNKLPTLNRQSTHFLATSLTISTLWHHKITQWDQKMSININVYFIWSSLKLDQIDLIMSKDEVLMCLK